MRLNRFTAATIMVAAVFVIGLEGQQPTRPNVPSGVLLEPLGTTGEAVFPAFEGFGPLKDGTNTLLIGYFSRNKEAVDVPIGPDNRIEPGGPDFGQPTHFLSGRQWGVFAITVPKDFGNKKLTWTLTVNGHTSTVSFWTNPQYWIDFYKNGANGNEPPRIKFSPTGPELIGPPREKFVQTLNATVGTPLELIAWAADQPPTITFESEGGGGAGAAASRTVKPPANEPLPAVIGGRVIAGTPGAAGWWRCGRRCCRQAWRHPDPVAEISWAGRREDRQRDDQPDERRRREEVRRGQDHGDVQRARNLLAPRAGQRQFGQRRRRRPVLLDDGARGRECEIGNRK